MALTDLVIDTNELKLVAPGMTFRLERAQVAGSVTLSILGASTLELTVIDPDTKLLSARFINNQADLRFDGRQYRLAQIRKSGDAVNLVFEDRAVAILRTYTSQRVALRSATMTRSRFVSSLVAESRRQLPALRVVTSARNRTPIASSKQRTITTSRIQTRDYGFVTAQGGIAAVRAGLVTVKGKPADVEQLRNLERVLDVGVSLRARRKVLVTAVATVTQEAGARNLKGGDRDSRGIFQQRPSQDWPASRDIERDATAFYVKAIANDKAHPNYRVTELAQSVQRSAFPDAYQQWAAEAERTVTAYMGEGEPDAGAVSDPAAGSGRYEFRRGSPEQAEDTWEATGRLADEVQWRRFIVGDTFYFINDAELMRSAPAVIVTEGVGGVDTLDYDVDVGKPVNTATYRAVVGATVAEPGRVAIVTDAGAADGRWLISEWTRDLWSPFADVTLTSPQRALPEPAGEDADPSTNAMSTNSAGPAATAQAFGTDITLDKRWAGTQAIFDQYVTPFMKGKGFPVTSTKRATKVTATGGVSEHWTGATKSYAIDYGTNSGEAAARELANEMGYTAWKANSYATFTVTVGNANFRVQILWGAAIDHADHIHVGITRI